MTKITMKAIAKAVKGTRGIKKNIITNLDCTYKALDDYIRKNPKALELIEEEETELGDTIEDELYSIAKMDTTDPKRLSVKLKAMEIYLRSKKAEKRGFRQVVEQKNVTENSEELTKRIDRLRQLNKEDYNKVCEVMGWTEDL